MIDAAARPPSPFPRWLTATVFVAVFLLVAVTSRDYGITWDEPAYFHASDLHVQWLTGIFDDVIQGHVGRDLDDNRIQAAWHWDAYHVPHPPFSRIVSGLMEAASEPFLHKFTGYRLGPALF